MDGGQETEDGKERRWGQGGDRRKATDELVAPATRRLQLGAGAEAPVASWQGRGRPRGGDLAIAESADAHAKRAGGNARHADQVWEPGEGSSYFDEVQSPLKRVVIASLMRLNSLDGNGNFLGFLSVPSYTGFDADSGFGASSSSCLRSGRHLASVSSLSSLGTGSCARDRPSLASVSTRTQRDERAARVPE